MQTLQFDHTSLLAERIQALLFSSELSSRIERELGSLRDQAKRRRALEALEMLRPGRFDKLMDAESASAAVFGAFLHCFVNETFGDELGAEGALLREAIDDVNVMSYGAPEDHLLRRGDSPFFDRTDTPRTETKADIVIESLQMAIALCEERMGRCREDWRWGRIHTYTWRHEMAKAFAPLGLFLNRGPFPAGGDGHTLNAASFVWGKNFEVWLIPAMRMVVDFNREEPAYMVIPMGQSCNYASRHYDDMLPLFLEGRLHPLPFNESNARRQHRDVLELAPL
jgi:acyl-homoserine-lactone acylase